MIGVARMADAIRPEARALLRRWGEVLATLAVAGLGVWWAMTGIGLPRWLGWATAALGAGLSFGAIQRARFTRTDITPAPGIVELDEGEIRYLGPRGGGVVALDAILALSLSADSRFWLVESADGTVLVIPRAATGSAALFDAFAALPGLDMTRLLRVSAQGPAPRAQVIWERTTHPLLT